MLAKLSLLITTSLALLAAAQSTCDVVSDGLLCCDDLEPGDAPILGPIFQLLGIPLPGIDTIVGLNCSSTNITGILNGACAVGTGHLSCCDINLGIVAIGCQNPTLPSAAVLSVLGCDC
ncbi:hypothetical protein A0H81_02278 [Grifola frondosa]|uniref:Hydrophobin n=1 Tax=Grifola frondosa TaxID=5627 RepID=A0A1C7MLC8_GRIFR|nr:hypothetical protein A0H81_02278 [Grifola frondosa]